MGSLKIIGPNLTVRHVVVDRFLVNIQVGRDLGTIGRLAVD